ncbi:MAG TPA: fructosamine kinase family protein [Steroidobacteraceae bacterium]|nr:fructosamine kinase family protein [Steroidobacteraceae bacterium]
MAPAQLLPLSLSLSARLGVQVADRPAARVQGGSINECYRWESASGPLFVKVAAAGKLAALEAEALGLEALRAANAIRVPAVLASGIAAERAYLVLEWIDLQPSSASAERSLGERLARQHAVTAPQFGWQLENTIGATPQPNAGMDDWVGFFRERRLRHQLELARASGHAGRLQARGAELLERMSAFFATHRPAPALLHGDLWGGNWGVGPRGAPVIFDPAVYFGDRETDLAMTRLFGGFGPSFRAAYQGAWPLEPGCETRVTLYNLYHVLNHLNLFGGGYLRQAESMIDRLLAELA